MKMNNTRNTKITRKGKLIIALIAGVLITQTTVVALKGNQPKIIGYTYDTGNTIWEIAQRHCPSEMDVRNVVYEIKKANEIDDGIIQPNTLYQVPVYEGFDVARETDYLDLNTVVDYDVSENGILLYTSDGNGYYIEK